MASEAQILANRRNAQKSTGPHRQKVLEIRCGYESIMQNKANLLKAQMNVN